MSLELHNVLEQRSRELGAHDLAAENVQANWDLLKKVPGINRLAGELQGCPVLVAGAGPSLDLAIPILQLLEQRPAIVACDRAARPLLAAGITPDYVVTAEISAAGPKKMRGLKGLEKTPLLFHPACHPDTVAEYPGPLYTCEHGIERKNKPSSAWSENPTKGKGALPRGSGVIVYAVGLAVHLGADPVILVGADLAYPGDRDHATGVSDCGDVYEAYIDIPAARGGTVKSDVFFAANVEELSAWFDGTLIQTSPQGARIPGWSHEDLAEVLR